MHAYAADFSVFLSHAVEATPFSSFTPAAANAADVAPTGARAVPRHRRRVGGIESETDPDRQLRGFAVLVTPALPAETTLNIVSNSHTPIIASTPNEAASPLRSAHRSGVLTKRDSARFLAPTLLQLGSMQTKQYSPRSTLPPQPLPICGLNHVSRVASDVRRSVDFYTEVLGFVEIIRPQFDFQGAWCAAPASPPQAVLC